MSLFGPLTPELFRKAIEFALYKGQRELTVYINSEADAERVSELSQDPQYAKLTDFEIIVVWNKDAIQ